MGKWLTIAILLGFLALALWDGYEQWILIVVSVPAWGWLAMALAGGLSIALGTVAAQLQSLLERQIPRCARPSWA
jgi:hypothetical protein